MQQNVSFEQAFGWVGQRSQQAAEIWWQWQEPHATGLAGGAMTCRAWEHGGSGRITFSKKKISKGKSLHYAEKILNAQKVKTQCILEGGLPLITACCGPDSHRVLCPSDSPS